LSRALILLNMGGMGSEDEVEIFLKNMFLDRHILPINPILRRFIANRVISSRADEVRYNLNRYLNGKSHSGYKYRLVWIKDLRIGLFGD